jgi:hydrogenase nickel incorporation protein HypA/HybF
MHELSIVGSLLSQVARQVEPHVGARVTRIDVRIGDASGVEAELFVTAFEQLRSGPCAAAELKIERVRARWTCHVCSRDFEPGEVLLCTACGNPGTLATGSELMLDRIELEVAHV